jgi:hypothetical protein
VQPVHPPALLQQPPVPPAPPAQQAAQPQPPPDLQPIAGPSGLQPQAHQLNLQPCQDLNYKELHTGIKQRCRKLRRQAKDVVTKLAPGSFLPKQPPLHSPSQNIVNPGPSS